MNVDTMLAALATETAASMISAWITMSLKGSVLVVVAWVLTRALRGGSAAMRHAVWTSALAGMLALPVLGLLAPTIELGGLPEVRLPRTSHVEQPAFAPPAEAASPANERVTAAPIRKLETPARETFTPERGFRFEGWLPFALILGVVVLIIRAAAGAFQLSIWTRRAHAVYDAGWLTLSQRLALGMGISRPVTLLRSDRACVPMTWGVVYPRVLLPSDADAWTDDRRTIVLLHELAHVKRLDAFTQFIAQLSVAVFWFNPIVWFAARQMRIEREHACDDFVLDAGARASDYAQDLLQIARSLVASGAPAAAALAMARRTELEGRLLAILNPHADRRPVSRKRLAASSLGVFALALPLAALRPAAQSPTLITPLSAAPETPAPSAPAPVAAAPTPSRAPAPPNAPKVHSAPAMSTPVAPTPPLPVATRPLFSFAAPALRVAMVPPVAFQLERLRASARPVADLETLIAVARAAAKLTSNYEKAELLLTVVKHYVRDDELRTAYLDAVASMTSDYDRFRALEPLLLKDSLPMKAVAQVVKIASMMTSDNDKSNLVVQTVRDHPTLTQPIRAALISTTGTMKSDYDRGRSIGAIVRRGGLSNAEIIDLINATRGMASSYEKSNALVLIASKNSMDDANVRKAYLSAAETISSATDYRRAVVRVLE